MSEGRKCKSCGRSIVEMHHNARYCLRDACRRAKSQQSQQTAKKEPPRCCSDVYSVMPGVLAGCGRRQGHVGTNYDPAEQAEERKSALAWLLKGRKPDPMRVRPVVLSAKARSWRESMGDCHRAAALNNGVAQ